jgi:hypothetical protein
VPAVRQSFCAHEECPALTAGEFIRIDPRKRPTVGGVWRFSAATPRGKHGDQASDLYEFDGFEGSISKGRSGRPNTSLGRGQDGPNDLVIEVAHPGITIWHLRGCRQVMARQLPRVPAAAANPAVCG